MVAHKSVLEPNDERSDPASQDADDLVLKVTTMDNSDWRTCH